MKYLVLIYNNPASREIWDALSPDERAVGLQAYEALDADLAASGELVMSEALDVPATGKRVSVRDGRATTTDGPFAEVKEHVGGFYLLECENIDRAVEIASRIPEAQLGLVEVRPVRDLASMLE